MNVNQINVVLIFNNENIIIEVNVFILFVSLKWLDG